MWSYTRIICSPTSCVLMPTSHPLPSHHEFVSALFSHSLFSYQDKPYYALVNATSGEVTLQQPPAESMWRDLSLIVTATAAVTLLLGYVYLRSEERAARLRFHQLHRQMQQQQQQQQEEEQQAARSHELSSDDDDGSDGDSYASTEDSGSTASSSPSSPSSSNAAPGRAVVPDGGDI